MTLKTLLGCGLFATAFSLVASNPALGVEVPSELLDPEMVEQFEKLMKAENSGLIAIGKGLGAGLAAGLPVVGGGPGIGRIGGSAVEAIARQPEAAGTIGTNMIITAALVEGATLFGIVVGLLAIFMI